MTLVLGVDGCPGGWCVVIVEVSSDALNVVGTKIAPTFNQVIAIKSEIICIDVPIGLTDSSDQRACDSLARKLLGQKQSSVFTPPCRAALARRDWALASEINLGITGRKLSKQTFAISPKICEVDHLMTPQLQQRVFEVHPELCFRALNDGETLLSDKSEAEGHRERWDLLHEAMRPSLPDQPQPLRWPKTICQLDDYIDALVGAWTAVCILRRRASRVPDKPEIDRRDLRMEMWYPANTD